MGVIYLAKCKTTGKGYIGKAVNFKYRQTRHLRDAVSSPKKHPKFYNALNKYGANNFEWSVLQDGCNTNDEYNAAEKYWIAKLDTWHNGYNCNAGGEGWQAGKDHPNWQGGLTRSEVSKRYHKKHKDQRADYAKQYRLKPLDEKDMQRFWSLVNKSSDCWQWLGQTSRNNLIFKQRSVRQIIKAQSLDDGMCFYPTCGNDKCVNPQHLKMLTRIELMSIKRSLRSSPTAAKIKAEDVLKIREMYASGQYSQTQIASLYDLTPSNISCMISGKSWRNI